MITQTIKANFNNEVKTGKYTQVAEFGFDLIIASLLSLYGQIEC